MRYFNKYFDGEFDVTNDTTKVSRYYSYIYGDNGVVAMRIFTNTKDTTDFGIDTSAYNMDKGAIFTDSLYYIHTDHLGSYCAMLNIQNRTLM